MLNLEDVNEFIYSNFEMVSTSKGGYHFNIRCPYCNDSKISKYKKRFHIEYKEDNCKFHCFNCGESGDFYKLHSFIKSIDKKLSWKLYHNYDNVKSLLKPKKINKPAITTIRKKTFNWIKKECLSINSTPNGYIQEKYINILKKFIKERMINIDIYICLKGTFKDRIIIPIFDKNDIIFFQGRCIFPNDVKYLNPSVDKQNIIFNKDNFIKKDAIFITEGILDAQSIGNNGTCCLGKEISDDFLTSLYEYTNELYIVLDNDKDGLKSLKKLMKNNRYKNKLKYFLIPKHFRHIKDINMLVMSNKNIDIKKFILDNSYSREKSTAKISMEKWRNEIN